MTLTAKQKEQLLIEVERNGGKLGKAAAVVGLGYNEAHDFISGLRAEKQLNIRRPELVRYIVGVKGICASWIVTEELTIARRRYDRGEVELCQYREGDTIYQLAIPRAVKVNRVPLFARRDF